MKIITLPLQGAATIEINMFEDSRGKFARLFCQKELRTIHDNQPLDQVNYSVTYQKGSIRGIHFQKPPYSEIKLIKCVKGKIFDIIVDLRKGSSTFLKWHGEVLSDENMKMIYIPKGFAHGFQTLENDCELLYFHNGYYHPEFESGLNYKDPSINIQWPLELTIMSDRDKNFDYINEDFEGLKL